MSNQPTCPNCGHSTAHSPAMGCLHADRFTFCDCTEQWPAQAKPEPKTLPQAREERDDAMATVEANTSEGWHQQAQEAIKYLAAKGPEFSTDDVWDRLVLTTDLKPHDPRALGPIMKACMKAGLIHAKGYTPSRRRHATPIRTYTGARA